VAMSGGDWSDLAGADVVLICAGVNERAEARPTAMTRAGG
jgi:malate/lactate dehydrogenase